MKTRTAWLTAAALCASAVTQAYAEGTNTTAGTTTKPPAGPLAGPPAAYSFEKMDANGDGKVTQDEYLAAQTELLKQRFAAMDANGDGVVTKDEMEKARPALRPPRPIGRHGQGALDPAAAPGGDKQK